MKKPILILSFLFTAFFGISQKAINDKCDGAIKIDTSITLEGMFGLFGLDTLLCQYSTSLARGIWYEIKGNDNIINIKTVGNNAYGISLYEGRCDALICTATSLIDGTFYLKKGKTYKMLISTNFEIFIVQPYKFTFTLLPSYPGDNCSDAPLLACDSTLQINLDHISQDKIIGGCNSFSNSPKIFWFTIAGDGNKMTITWDNTNFAVYGMTIVKNKCDTIRCLGSIDVRENVISTNPGENYLIAIETNGLSSGIFNVSMECTPVQEGEICSKAKPINCNDSFTDIIVTKANYEPNALSLPKYTTWYVYEGDGREIEIEVGSSSSSGQLYLFNGKANSSCINNEYVYSTALPQSKKIFLNTAVGEKLFFRLSNYSQDAYSLKIKCGEIADTNYLCRNAKPLNICSDSIKIENLAGLNIDYPKCIQNPAPGKWYSFSSTEDYIKFTTSTDQYLQFTLLEDNCDTFKCITSSPVYINANVDAYIKVTAGQNYLLYISNYSFTEVDDYLKVSCVNRIVDGNYTCADAKPLNCNVSEQLPYQAPIVITDIENANLCKNKFGAWYTFEGDGKLINIHKTYVYFDSTEIYTGSCENLTCVGVVTWDDLSIKTDAGTKYYIKSPLTNASSTLLSVTCTESDSNSVCEQAQLISCSQSTFSIDFKRAYNIPGNEPFEKLLWFKIRGEGLISEIISAAGNLPFIRLYDGNCANLNLMGTSEFGFSYFLESGKEYFISMLANGDELQNLNINCYAASAISECTSAGLLNCGDSITVPIKYAKNKYFKGKYYNFVAKELWFKIQGDGSKAVLDIQNANNYNYFAYEIYTNNCDNKTAQSYPSDTSLYLTEINQLIINTEPGQFYFVKLLVVNNGDFTIKYKCDSDDVNYSCQKEVALSCGDTLFYIFNAASGNNIRLINPQYKNEYLVYNTQWYNVSADSSNTLFFRYPYNQYSNLYTVIYKSPDINCDSLILVDVVTQPQYYILPEDKGYIYHIALGQSDLRFNVNTNQKPAQIFLLCNVDPNSPCKEAVTLNCNNKYQLTNSYFKNSAFGDCYIEKKAVWTRFTGTGEVLNFDINYKDLNGNTVTLLIGEGNSCDDLMCTTITNAQNDSRFIFKTTKDVTYYIQFFNQYNSIFDLTLDVTCQTANNENETCAKAKDIICLEPIKVILLENGVIDSTSLCSNPVRGKYFHFIGDGNFINFKLKQKSANSIGYEVIENDCQQGRCLFQGNFTSKGENITIDTKKNTDYYIKFFAIGDVSFEFESTCYEPHENTSCVDATFLKCGTSLKINLNSPLGYSGSNNCTGNSKLPHWFLLPKKKQWYRLTFDSTNLNQQFTMVLLKGNCNAYECKKSWNAIQQDILFNTTEDDDFYLVISQGYYGVDKISFNIQCEDSATNDECEDAIDISCNSIEKIDLLKSSFIPNNFNCSNFYSTGDIWYKLTGIDSLVSLNFSATNNSYAIALFESNNGCQELKCLRYFTLYDYSQPQNIRFFGRKGIEYYLQIQRNQDLIQKFDMTVNCLPVNPLDDCIDAGIVLTGKDSISINLENATFDLNVEEKCGLSWPNGVNNGIWYQLIGSDSLVTFNFSDKSAPTFVQASVLEGDCNNLKCLGNFSISAAQPFKLFGEKGKKYKIVFYQNQYTVKNLKLIIERQAVLKNWKCEAALPLICNDSIQFNTINLTKSANAHSCLYSDQTSAWYSYAGDGNNIRITPRNTDFYLYMGIDSNCDAPCIANAISIYPNTSFSINTTKGKFYNLQFGSYDWSKAIDVNIGISCDSGYMHNNYAFAQQLQCGSYMVKVSRIVTNFEDKFNYFSGTKLYYKFTGNDSMLVLKNYLNPDVGFFIFDDNGVIYDFRNGDSFKTDKEKKYFLVLIRLNQIENTADLTFDVEYGCNTVTTNDPPDRVDLQLSIAPNPFYDKTTLHIKSRNGDKALMIIRDVMGKEILRKNILINVGLTTVEINGLMNNSNGVYQIELIGHNGYKIQNKIVKME
jgi:hypothetical protein